ncbi:hypothetical protein ACTFIW_005189 [Dictyostelium discoideum]
MKANSNSNNNTPSLSPKVLKSFPSKVSIEITLLRDIYYNHFCYLNDLIEQSVDINDYRYVNCLGYLKTTKIRPGFAFSFSQIVFMKSVGLKNLLAQNEYELKVIKNVIDNISSKTMVGILNDKVKVLTLESESLRNKIEYVRTIKSPIKTVVSI